MPTLLWDDRMLAHAVRPRLARHRRPCLPERSDDGQDQLDAVQGARRLQAEPDPAEKGQQRRQAEPVSIRNSKVTRRRRTAARYRLRETIALKQFYSSVASQDESGTEHAVRASFSPLSAPEPRRRRVVGAASLKSGAPASS